MSRYKRLPQLAEKDGPDEFISFVDHAAHFIAAYKAPIIGAVLGVFVVWVGYIIVQNRQESKLNALSLEMHEASLKGDKAAYEQILQNQKGKQAQLARLPLIQTYSKEGNADRTLSEIDATLGKAPDFVDAQLRVSKAQILWDQSKFDEALAAIKTLTENEEGPMGAYPKFLQAQILEDMGKRDEAVKIYETLSAPEAKDAQVQEWAKNRLVLNRVQAAPAAAKNP